MLGELSLRERNLPPHQLTQNAERRHERRDTRARRFFDHIRRLAQHGEIRGQDLEWLARQVDDDGRRGGRAVLRRDHETG
jgi:hypothetical protein